MEAYFYTFNKRRNSTAKPTGDGLNLSISLKEYTDIRFAEFEIHYNILSYNYLYVPFLSRYYWIRDIQSIAKDTYLISCEIDVLATYIDSVRGQQVYCNMSSYNYQELIDDSRVVPVNRLIDSDTTYGDFNIISPVTPTVYSLYQFLSCVTTDGLLNGIDVFFGQSTVSDYFQNVADRAWYKQLMEDTLGADGFEAINELYWSPLIPQQCHSVTQKSAMIYDVPIEGMCLSSPDVKTHHSTITIPKPSVRDFRYSDKYVKYYLTIPYCGVITVPTTLTYNASVLEYSYGGDCLTGQITVSPKVNGVSLGIFGTSLKAPIALAQQDSHVAQMLRTGGVLVPTAMKAFGSTTALSMVGASIVRGMIDMPDIDITGSSNGSISAIGCRETIGSVSLKMIECDSNVDPTIFTAISGRPCEKIITIANGYIQTQNASVHFNGLSSEIEQFNNLLNGGVYIE